jgi:hypothetical protein
MRVKSGKSCIYTHFTFFEITLFQQIMAPHTWMICQIKGHNEYIINNITFIDQIMIKTFKMSKTSGLEAHMASRNHNIGPNTILYSSSFI